MRKQYSKKLSKEIKWAIYIAQNNGAKNASEIQNNIQKTFKIAVPLVGITTYLAEVGREDFSVEHRRIEYGCNNNQFKFTKET